MTPGPSDTAPPAPAAGDTPPRRPHDAPVAPGQMLAGRYAIEREVGRGGMATVWLAQETKHERQVAVKVLHPDLAASLGAERFLREIGISARLAHPHIVPLIDSGEADGLLYFVAPFVAGGSLRARLDAEGRLPVREAVRIAQDVAAALDFAHRSGFVHRDVKPENILFADGHAVLADFGVAQLCCDAEDAARVTEAGVALGTPEYMSPEQAAGERQLDGRSDIYALACVVHEMLAGAPPFHGTTARATMARHVTEPPPPLRTLRPDAPPSVERALARALAKDPRARQPSAATFAAELASESYEHARVSAAVPRSIAVLPFVNASPDPENEYLSDGITDELIDALAKVEGLRVASRTSVFALKGKPNDVRAIGALLGASVVLEGTVRKAGQRLRITAQLSSADEGRLLWSQRYDRDLTDVFEIQDEIARTIVGTLRATSLADLGEPEPVRRAGSVTAYGHYLRGRFEWNKRSQEAIAEGIRWFERAIAEDPGYALAYTGLADSYALQVDYRSVPVHEGLERAKHYARRALALDTGSPRRTPRSPG
jgi:serine/threonine protein kinase